MSELKRIHTLNISKKITVTGVINVESFDDKCVMLELSDNLLTINGNNFNIDNFSIEEGNLTVTGEVNEIKYSKTREKISFLKKLIK
ncbi:MAG: YabP/YqfC family sporulation protein [Christensenellales bacterium]|jgi:sporulation protein YabP